MEKWIFKIKNTKEALNFYNENGYVGFSDLISLNQNKILCDAFDSAINKGVISQGYEDMIAIDDAVYASDEFMSITKNKKIVDLVKTFLNSESIELQHSKINSKPIDLHKLNNLNFKNVNIKKFPSVRILKKLTILGHSAPIIINAANEVCVDLFLKGKIEFDKEKKLPPLILDL